MKVDLMNDKEKIASVFYKKMLQKMKESKT